MIHVICLSSLLLVVVIHVIVTLIKQIILSIATTSRIKVVVISIATTSKRLE